MRRHTLLGVLWTLATICALLSAVLAVNAFGGATGQDGPDRMTATGWDGACAQSLDWPSVLGGRTDQTPRVSGEFSVLPLGVDCTVTVTPLGWTTIVPADWGLTGSLTVMVLFVVLAVFSPERRSSGSGRTVKVSEKQTQALFRPRVERTG